jgi:hypothetical protein
MIDRFIYTLRNRMHPTRIKNRRYRFVASKRSVSGYLPSYPSLTPQRLLLTQLLVADVRQKQGKGRRIRFVRKIRRRWGAILASLVEIRALNLIYLGNTFRNVLSTDFECHEMKPATGQVYLDLAQVN